MLYFFFHPQVLSFYTPGEMPCLEWKASCELSAKAVTVSLLERRTSLSKEALAALLAEGWDVSPPPVLGKLGHSSAGDPQLLSVRTSPLASMGFVL